MIAPQSDAALRLMDACDRLVREARSANEVTTRQVAEAAGTSISAISHNFGALENLIAAVAMRAYGKLNHERMTFLQAAIERHKPAHPPLCELIRALIEPPVMWHFNRDNAYRVLISIDAMLTLSDKPHRYRQIETSIDAHLAIVDHLHRCAPWFSAAEIGWRVYAILGIRTQVLRGRYRSVAMTLGKMDLTDPQVVIAGIVDIAVPMFARPDSSADMNRF